MAPHQGEGHTLTPRESTSPPGTASMRAREGVRVRPLREHRATPGRGSSTKTSMEGAAPSAPPATVAVPPATVAVPPATVSAPPATVSAPLATVATPPPYIQNPLSPHLRSSPMFRFRFVLHLPHLLHQLHQLHLPHQLHLLNLLHASVLFRMHCTHIYTLHSYTRVYSLRISVGTMMRRRFSSCSTISPSTSITP
jgi:hypothetical protein